MSMFRRAFSSPRSQPAVPAAPGHRHSSTRGIDADRVRNLMVVARDLEAVARDADGPKAATARARADAVWARIETEFEGPQ